MVSLRAIVPLLLAPLWSAAAGAQDGLALSCPVCHGSGHDLPWGIPPIASFDAAGLAGAMKAFRDGTRPGTSMPRLTAKLTDAEIDAVAAQVAAAPR